MSNKKGQGGRIAPSYYLALHFTWWGISWLLVAFNKDIVVFANSLIPTKFMAIGALFLILSFTSIINFPLLEIAYYKFLNYSLSSLTALVLICFILALASVVNVLFIVPFVLTPLVPLLYESITPILREKKKSKITKFLLNRKIEFSFSLLSVSVIDISVLALEFALIHFGVINLGSIIQ